MRISQLSCCWGKSAPWRNLVLRVNGYPSVMTCCMSTRREFLSQLCWVHREVMKLLQALTATQFEQKQAQSQEEEFNWAEKRPWPANNPTRIMFYILWAASGKMVGLQNECLITLLVNMDTEMSLSEAAKLLWEMGTLSCESVIADLVKETLPSWKSGWRAQCPWRRWLSHMEICPVGIWFCPG